MLNQTSDIRNFALLRTRVLLSCVGEPLLNAAATSCGCSSGVVGGGGDINYRPLAPRSTLPVPVPLLLSDR